MNTAGLIAALSLGLLGSFHCVGMCGPIALALPVQHLNPIKKFLSVLLYNLGRAFTYALFGLLFGLLGQGLFMGGFQQLVSVVLGSLILLSVLYSYFFHKGLFQWHALNTFVLRLKSGFGALFKQRSAGAMFLIGLLNGLLPCGLVYVAIAGAIAGGHYAYGAAFMFLFGLGTLPMMLSLSLFGQFLQVKYRNLVRRSVPVFVSLMAVLMILRGLNLGIPYISPKIEAQHNRTEENLRGMDCCAKHDAHCSPQSHK